MPQSEAALRRRLAAAEAQGDLREQGRLACALGRVLYDAGKYDEVPSRRRHGGADGRACVVSADAVDDADEGAGEGERGSG